MQNPIPGPDAIDWLGVHYRTIMPPVESGGEMSILDTVSPPGSGPPRHIHHDTDETFALLSGDAEFWLAGKRLTRGPVRPSLSRAAWNILSAFWATCPRAIW